MLTDEIEKEMEERIMKEVNEATDYAENAPYAEPEACASIMCMLKKRGNE